MKITKTQLKQIIKEEISRILSEDEGQELPGLMSYITGGPQQELEPEPEPEQDPIVQEIPEGAIVMPSSDPHGIAWSLGDSYGEIGVFKLSMDILKQIGSRRDLKFMAFRKSMLPDDFIQLLPEFWYRTAKSAIDRGYGGGVSLPDWVYEFTGRPSLEDDDWD